MVERLISPDHLVRGSEFELWSDGSWPAGQYPNWYLATEDPAVAEKHKVPLNTVLVGEEFDPPLTDKEMRGIGEIVMSYYVRD